MKQKPFLIRKISKNVILKGEVLSREQEMGDLMADKMLQNLRAQLPDDFKLGYVCEYVNKRTYKYYWTLILL